MLEINNPITGERLQVAENDFEKKMSWFSAQAACTELGNDWRLPTQAEFKLMYKELHEIGKGNFNGSHYWTSEEDPIQNHLGHHTLAYYFSFTRFVGGGFGCNGKSFQASVRAVRNL